MITPTPLNPIRILLADDDLDDRYLFNRELETLPFNTQLTTVEDGEALMNYLIENFENLPDILFLDHNMPRKNGAECLQEIKAHANLKELPVVLYSTYVQEEMGHSYYATGAHYYIKKTDQKELRIILDFVLSSMVEKKLFLPARENFILTAAQVERSKVEYTHY